MESRLNVHENKHTSMSRRQNLQQICFITYSKSIESI